MGAECRQIRFPFCSSRWPIPIAIPETVVPPAFHPFSADCVAFGCPRHHRVRITRPGWRSHLLAVCVRVCLRCTVVHIVQIRPIDS